jgi:hypothetical protein
VGQEHQVPSDASTSTSSVGQGNVTVQGTNGGDIAGDNLQIPDPLRKPSIFIHGNLAGVDVANDGTASEVTAVMKKLRQKIF